MAIKTNAIAVVVEDILAQLRVPSITSIATGGVRVPGDDLVTPMVLVSVQDGQGGPTSNLNGEELFSTVYVNILAVVPAGDLEVAVPIDDAIRKQILKTASYPVRSNTRGLVYSIVLKGSKNYIGPGKNNSGVYLYYGGYYMVRAEGNELPI